MTLKVTLADTFNLLFWEIRCIVSWVCVLELDSVHVAYDLE